MAFSNRHCNITTSTLYSELRPMHFSQADLALVCFQIDNPISLKNIRESWLPEFKQYCPNTPYVCQKIVIFLNSSILQYNLKISISCLLIGLKVDIRKAAKADKNNNSTIISKEYAVTFANSIGAKVSIKKLFLFSKRLYTCFLGLHRMFGEICERYRQSSGSCTKLLTDIILRFIFNARYFKNSSINVRHGFSCFQLETLSRIYLNFR